MVGVVCVAACCILVSGITLYMTFENSDEKKNEKTKSIRRWFRYLKYIYNKFNISDEYYSII